MVTVIDSGSTSAIEVERKYDVDADAAVPELSGVSGVRSVMPAKRVRLKATYYDTDDLRLRSAGITLRHRTGGPDAGWHLKLPSGADREEITVKAPAGTVPEVLAALVRSRTRSASLIPLAELATVRVVHRLLGPAGEPVVEIADDTVTGRRLPAGEKVVWREWEAELLGGPRDLLDAVQVELLAAGAAPSRSSSKVARVLGRPLPRGTDRAWWSEPTGRGEQRTAGSVVQAHLAEQVEELKVRDPQARRDRPDAVHKMRVSTRRLRSALATFRPLLQARRTDPLRVELRWLAGVLGEVRDAEVMRGRLLEMLAAEPTELVLGKVRDQLDSELQRRHSEAHVRLLEELDGQRYLRLLDDLEELVTAPPFRKAARRAGEAALTHTMRRTWDRLDRAMHGAGSLPPGPEQQKLLHEVRKDAKRARYAAESLAPAFGRPAKRFAAQMEALQESLGDMQDGVATRQVVLELGRRSHLAGRNGFTLGRLHALEQTRAEAVGGRWHGAQAVASRPKLRRWFDD